MPTPANDDRLNASTEIAADPARVWQVISDVRRIGEWSPECTGVTPLGAMRKGTWLLGFNRRGRVRWVTLSRVTRFEPEREIGWKVTTNGAVWSYELTPVGDRTRLVETRQTPEGVGAVARGFTRLLLGGQRVHDQELEAGMSRSLERIKSIVES